MATCSLRLRKTNAFTLGINQTSIISEKVSLLPGSGPTPRTGKSVRHEHAFFDPSDAVVGGSFE